MRLRASSWEQPSPHSPSITQIERLNKCRRPPPPPTLYPNTLLPLLLLNLSFWQLCAASWGTNADHRSSGQWKMNWLTGSNGQNVAVTQSMLFSLDPAQQAFLWSAAVNQFSFSFFCHYRVGRGKESIPTLPVQEVFTAKTHSMLTLLLHKHAKWLCNYFYVAEAENSPFETANWDTANWGTMYNSMGPQLPRAQDVKNWTSRVSIGEFLTSDY